MLSKSELMIKCLDSMYKIISLNLAAALCVDKNLHLPSSMQL